MEERNAFGYANGCSNDVQKSRRICNNPEQFHVVMNCTGKDLIQCPGNNNEQCIFGEDICNGIYDCIDRFDL